MRNHSKLVKMHIRNFRCINNDGLTVELDNIVCLVGANNAGKSTVLCAYEYAVTPGIKLNSQDFNDENHPVTIELWVHIPEGVENIDEKWKEPQDGLLLVKSKWQWDKPGDKVVRQTWNPEENSYSEGEKAAGLDTVFNSRLPKPFRVGALDNPLGEYKELMSIALEPLIEKYNSFLKEESEINNKLREFIQLANQPIKDMKSEISEVQSKIDSVYGKIFSGAKINISISIDDLQFDPKSLLTKGSNIVLTEYNKEVDWTQQGTGSQRALFWSMLQVRSELKSALDLKKNSAQLNVLKDKQSQGKNLTKAELKKLEELESTQNISQVPILPGHMLLIDEPEIALHPSAVRAAKQHLYNLAAASGWQVMISTHHPAFIDPLEDHTTIVRLQRDQANISPKTYKADEMEFTDDEKENLKALMLFDEHFAEVFFAKNIILVEGDTEFAAFQEVMNQNMDKYPFENRPLIVRARGKATLAALVKMLTHFKVNFSILHDIDSPKTESGDKKNPAYTINRTILSEIKKARDKGITVIHYFSCPNFEEHHGMELPNKEKPFESWKRTKENESIRSSIENILDILVGNKQDDVQGDYEKMLKDWINENGKDKEPRYQFIE